MSRLLLHHFGKNNLEKKIYISVNIMFNDGYVISKT